MPSDDADGAKHLWHVAVALWAVSLPDSCHSVRTDSCKKAEQKKRCDVEVLVTCCRYSKKCSQVATTWNIKCLHEITQYVQTGSFFCQLDTLNEASVISVNKCSKEQMLLTGHSSWRKTSYHQSVWMFAILFALCMSSPIHEILPAAPNT